MTQNDDPLRALLKNWQDIEPRAGFEADVRRRIRLAEAEQPAPVELLEWLQGLMWKPTLSIAVALAASVMIGASAGMLSASHPKLPTDAELQFMSGGTLSGGYVKLASEGGR